MNWTAESVNESATENDPSNGVMKFYSLSYFSAPPSPPTHMKLNVKIMRGMNCETKFP